MVAVITQKVVDKAVYVSLIGPFLGKYARIPYADNSIEAAWICNQDRRLKSLWCSTYTLEAAQECIRKYGGEIIELYADGLEFHLHELKQLREQLKGKKEVSSAF